MWPAVTCLQHSRCPDAKSIVFSQWEGVLQLVYQGLLWQGGGSFVMQVQGAMHLTRCIHRSPVSAVGVYGSAKNRDVIEKFKHDDTSVLLLPIKSGGNGLNLVEATHVFLVEPLLSVGLEAQAIGTCALPRAFVARDICVNVLPCFACPGRVDRLGQTRPTFVHRFIVRDSVEEVVVDLASKRSQEMENATRGVKGAKDGEGVITRGDVIAMFHHRDRSLQ